eukprot:CAMPEP_0194757574 /NCGR_PEP_ID=MMETSP0323_2-20130528/11045_1 /TAXON_ID=2866 ORGANISM="Crypthecodinium cohnii, Strain Seligo" /NCGR_SAMPLE_ID=MMETSP0323_2 /ASSEMBLY_ACC=CAM_ASM_000346 /LENGTH=116 /DNA_ID=CAMNT_0039677571 /DNA_START=90 /DNA_END=440 /DNA_ORIENTATION=-
MASLWRRSSIFALLLLYKKLMWDLHTQDATLLLLGKTGVQQIDALKERRVRRYHVELVRLSDDHAHALLGFEIVAQRRHPFSVLLRSGRDELPDGDDVPAGLYVVLAMLQLDTLVN